MRFRRTIKILGGGWGREIPGPSPESASRGPFGRKDRGTARIPGYALGVLALLLGSGGCGGPSEAPGSITLATTTSTQDSGLLEVLVPMFRESTGIDVKVVAVGTGQALQLGRRGDADVLLVHDPEGERAFLADGDGSTRLDVMSNDFVLVGPPSDPGDLKGARSAAEAFGRIARLGLPFVSRGDDSGTHRKERALWRDSGVDPSGPWYVEAGAGMGAVLRMADQKRAHALADRATYLAQGKALGLAILSEGDPSLRNPYAVIVVDPRKHPGVREAGARRFAEFLVSPGARSAIARFGVEKHGRPLFHVDGPDPP